MYSPRRLVTVQPPSNDSVRVAGAVKTPRPTQQFIESLLTLSNNETHSPLQEDPAAVKDLISVVQPLASAVRGAASASQALASPSQGPASPFQDVPSPFQDAESIFQGVGAPPQCPVI